MPIRSSASYSSQKKKTFKNIIPIILLLLLVLGGGVGLYLSGKNQDNRQQAAADPGMTKPGYTMVFNDEFNCDFVDNIQQVPLPSQYDTCLAAFYRKWFTRYMYDGGRQDFLNPDLEIERYRDKGNHVSSNGTLKLIAKKTGNFNTSNPTNPIYESGMIRSKYDFQRNHYIEARMKLPPENATFGAFWLASKDALWPPELEIAEFWNIRNQPISWVYHSYKRTNSAMSQVAGQILYRDPAITLSETEPNSAFYSFGMDADLSRDFHIYALDWQGDVLTWYVDGRKTFQTSGPSWAHRDGSAAGPAQILLNLAMQAPFQTAGYPSNSVFPQQATMEIDYVRVYKRDPTTTADRFNEVNFPHTPGTTPPPPQPTIQGVNVAAPSTANQATVSRAPWYILKAVSATKSLNASTGPEKAVDDASGGIGMTTSWNAGTGAPQSITVDLGKVGTVSSIVMMPNQSPAGNTTHKIYVSSSLPGNNLGTLATTISQSTKTGQPVEAVFAKPLTNVRYVTIQTTASPSWISWFDIKVYP